ncbi:helix-turn-helix transcriptional regulator [Deinococcus budaensis]|uniref:DNA-binding transcriptional ArsR family regulator n=1 Tax=Deinococcus budaensis TaxID=1665626 RepID=A0A7W8GEX9_9DEIO|nr:winged helix-turn-helix domain-containing protein [Deinococcus budaensis]MBB5234068.1 DNA-binding transcriptional ArsR family regulator [Deinococcus budaensis]
MRTSSSSSAGTPPAERPAEGSWTFLTNHTHVLLCLAQGEGSTLREVAGRVGITERAVQRIVADLEEAGVLSKVREGRRNRYRIDTSRPLRHPLEAHRSLHDLLSVLGPPDPLPGPEDA